MCLMQVLMASNVAVELHWSKFGLEYSLSASPSFGVRWIDTDALARVVLRDKVVELSAKPLSTAGAAGN